MSRKADVCLILEGTYPYISGGVSSWVHQLISALRDIRFALMIILPTRDYIREIKYAIPDNVVEMNQVFIHDFESLIPSARSVNAKSPVFKQMEEFIINAVSGKTTGFEPIYQYLRATNPDAITLDDLIFSKSAWDMICNLYKHYALNVSFIDYFWTYRFSVLPLYQVIQAQLPDALIYHAISTGYAGLLGVCGRIMNNSVLLLTEHGIYTKERKIEISQASWIYDEKEETVRPQEHRSFFKQWWINFFNFMSSLCYENCSEIITLYEGNQREQIKCGADNKKLSIIPNGIDLANATQAERSLKKDTTRFVIGFVGRVVPIKDIKTFIKACKIVIEQLPDSEVLIIGPTDEDEEYYSECVLLRNMLGIEHKITFTGRVDVKEYYAQLDLLVLTSESEAQPLVILEANSMGIPVVASDVGACRELLYGRAPDDKAMGNSGLITGVGSPRETAEAIIRILTDPPQYRLMSMVGIERARLFYNQEDLFARYLNLYEKYLY